MQSGVPTMTETNGCEEHSSKTQWACVYTGRLLTLHRPLKTLLFAQIIMPYEVMSSNKRVEIEIYMSSSSFTLALQRNISFDHFDFSSVRNVNKLLKEIRMLKTFGGFHLAHHQFNRRLKYGNAHRLLELQLEIHRNLTHSSLAKASHLTLHPQGGQGGIILLLGSRQVGN